MFVGRELFVENGDELFGPGDDFVAGSECGDGGSVACVGGESFVSEPEIIVEVCGDFVEEVAGPADGAGGEWGFAHGDDGRGPGVEQGDGGF